MKLTVTVLSDCGTEQETRNMILVFVFCLVSEEDQDQTRHYYTGNIITILNNKYKYMFQVSLFFPRLTI